MEDEIKPPIPADEYLRRIARNIQHTAECMTVEAKACREAKWFARESAYTAAVLAMEEVAKAIQDATKE